MDGILIADTPAWLGRLGWSLLHFLWQGAVIGLVYAVALPLMRRASSNARYLVSLAFLLALGCCPVLTFWIWGSSVPAAAGSVEIATSMQTVVGSHLSVSGGTGDVVANLLGWLGLVAPWIVPAWAAGVTLLCVRLFRDGFRVRAIVADAEPVTADHWTALVARVARAVGLSRPVRLLESLAIEVPIVVGWLRPVVLVPSSVLLGLDPRQLELILVHELAHVRRGDYVINLLQIAIETLLFYHPVVGWISARVRQERENCCDDLVVAASGDRLAYARALLELDGLRGLAASAVIASNGGNLAVRIRRIVGMPAPQRGAADWIAGIALTAFGAATLSVGQIEEQRRTLEPDVPVPIVAAGESTDAPEDHTAAPATTGMTPTLASEQAAAESGDAPGSAAVDQDPPVHAATTTSTITRTSSRVDGGRAGSAPDISEITPRPAPMTSAAAPTPPHNAGPGVQSPGQVSAGEALEREAEPAEPAIETPAPVQDAATTALASTPTRQTVDSAGHGPVLEGTAAPDLAEPAPVITGGKAVRVVAPEFPPHARHDGHQGYVVVAFTIGKNGRPRDIEVVDVGPRDYFSKAAVRAIRHWRFEPVRIDGQLVEKRMRQRFKFVLDGGESTDPDECVMLTGSRLCR